MDVSEKIKMVKQVGEEIVTEQELNDLLSTKKNFIAYDGFEPSGTNIHIAQGLLRAINVNKMIKAGCTFKMLIADWHAWANNKMDGNLEAIQKVGQYLVEVWKACDMDLAHVQFVNFSDVVKDDNYWKIVMQIARNSTVKRIQRCGQIMGRKEDEVQQASQILYPCLQAADIFYLKADVCQLGMDQRKVNMLAREIGPKLGFWKPVVVSHHMLMGLGKPPEKTADTEDRVLELKMSKSKPDTAIFMDDTAEDIKRKISKAYCPEKIVDENPILEYFKYIIFEKYDIVSIERPEKYGGNLAFNNYQDMESSFSSGNLHPMDLKNAACIYLNKMIEPVRERLEKSKTAQKLREEIKSFKVTR
jgi:tyrosyl-tRNA synthetase